MLSTMKIDYSFQPARLTPEQAQPLRIAIEAFHNEYCAALDSNNVELWPEFFTEDGLYRITSRENANLGLLVGLVYAEGRDMMYDRAIAIARTQMFAPRHTLHVVSNTRVIDDANGTIEAEANFMLVQTLIEGPSTVHLAGKYYDRFIRHTSGHLLLKERQVIHDTEILATDLVYPV